MASLSHNPAARKEYGASILWYRSRSSDAAFRFVTEVEAELIASHPDRYPRITARSRFREVILQRFPFSIIYEVVLTGEIRIIAVAHSSRKRGYWNRRK